MSNSCDVLACDWGGGSHCGSGEKDAHNRRAGAVLVGVVRFYLAQ
jgi:hypothetical protein